MIAVFFLIALFVLCIYIVPLFVRHLSCILSCVRVFVHFMLLEIYVKGLRSERNKQT